MRENSEKYLQQFVRFFLEKKKNRQSEVKNGIRKVWEQIPAYVAFKKRWKTIFI